MTGKRKFIAYQVTLIIAALLCWSKAMSGEEFSGVVKLCLAAFVIGNGFEHWLTKDKTTSSPPQ